MIAWSSLQRTSVSALFRGHCDRITDLENLLPLVRQAFQTLASSHACWLFRSFPAVIVNGKWSFQTLVCNSRNCNPKFVTPSSWKIHSWATCKVAATGLQRVPNIAHSTRCRLCFFFPGSRQQPQEASESKHTRHGVTWPFWKRRISIASFPVQHSAQSKEYASCVTLQVKSWGTRLWNESWACAASCHTMAGLRVAMDPLLWIQLDVLEGVLGKAESLTHWRRLRSGSTPSVVFHFLFYSGQIAARMMLQVSRLEILGTLRWKVSWLPATLPQKVLGVVAKDVNLRAQFLLRSRRCLQWLACRFHSSGWGVLI